MKQKLKIRTFLILSMGSLSILAILAIGSFAIYEEYAKFRRESERVRQELDTEARERVREEVERARITINNLEIDFARQCMRDLHDRAELLHDLSVAVLANLPPDTGLTPQEFLRRILSPLGREIDDYQVFIISMDDNAGEEGASFPVSQNVRLSPELRADILHNIAALGPASGSFHFPHGVAPQDATAHYSLRYCPHINWYIVVMRQDTEYQARIKEQVLQWLDSYNTKHVDYLFIGQWDGTSLLGPGKGRNMLLAADRQVQEIVRSLIREARRGGGFVEYIMPELQGKRSERKISYVLPVEKWQWYVGTGMYTVDVEEQIGQRHEALGRSVREHIIFLCAAAGLVLLVLLALLRKITSLLNADLAAYHAFLGEAARQKAQTDPQRYNFGEFAELAHIGNRMVNEREHYHSESQHNKDRFEQLIENAPIPISISDESGKILFLNHTFTNMYGYDTNDMPDLKAWFELAYPDEEYRRFLLEDWQATLEKCPENSPRIASREVRMHAKNGEVHFAEISVTISSGIMIATIVDNTLRKRAEEELAESARVLRQAQRIARLAGWKAIPRQGRVGWSEGAQEMFEMHTLPDTIDETVNLVLPQYRPAVQQMFEACLESGQELAIAAEATTGSGNRIWLEVRGIAHTDRDGTPCILGIVQDITQKRASDLALRHSEELFRAVFNSAPIGIILLDHDGRRIIAANNELCAVFGYAHEELAGMDIRRLLHPTQHESFARALTQAGEPGQAPLRDYKGASKSGRLIHLEIILSLTRRDPQDEPNYLLIIHDVTERRRLEEQLRQSEKLQAIGQLAGGIAHDFNNQLAGIMGYAELLQMRCTEESLRAYAENIIQSTQRAADLTGQLLAFARKGKFQSVPVNINSVVREVVSILSHTIDRRVEIRTELCGDLPLTHGDPTQIQNALLNLALNARDAMPAGGVLCIISGLADLCHAQEPDMCFPVDPGSYIRLAVTDTGCGMDAATMKKIFEPFFTTKENGQGTGMGLASVYGTMKLHGGGISVSSAPGMGSEFALYFPLKEAEHAPPAQANMPTLAQGGLVLLVDDEQPVRELAGEHLINAGLQVHACANGREALEYYRHNWREVALVILDLIMPEMNGRDTFMSIREINPQARVLLSSGYSIDGQAQDLLRAGALDFLQKPFLRHTLLEKVAAALNTQQEA